MAPKRRGTSAYLADMSLYVPRESVTDIWARLAPSWEPPAKGKPPNNLRSAGWTPYPRGKGNLPARPGKGCGSTTLATTSAPGKGTGCKTGSVRRPPLWAPANYRPQVHIPITEPAPSTTLATLAASNRTSIGRRDVPKIRKLTRGTVAEAISALASDGQAALVEALLADRFARSETATRQCLINT